MTTAPFVDDLRPGDTQTLGYLVCSDQILYVNLASHGPILGNGCTQVVYARTQAYYVSTNIHT